MRIRKQEKRGGGGAWGGGARFFGFFCAGWMGLAAGCGHLSPSPAPAVSPPAVETEQALGVYYRLLDGVTVNMEGTACHLRRPKGGDTIRVDRRDDLQQVQALSIGWVPESLLAVGGWAKPRGGDRAWPERLARLRDEGWLQMQLRRGTEPLGVFKPAPPLGVGKDLNRPRLSRFAYAHFMGGRWVLESPLTPVRVDIRSPEFWAVLAGSNRLTAAETGRVWGWLARAGMAVAGDDEEGLDGDGPLAYWSFHDLLFHGASLSGRKGEPATGTYRWRGRLDSPPMTRPADPPTGVRIELPEPGESERKALQKPLSTVLDQRRSRREAGSTNDLDVGRVAACLYASARVIWVQAISNDADHVTYRPYPSGGARHSLEIYLWVRECRGLAPGLYHYDPIWHALQPVPLAGPRRAEFEQWDPFAHGEDPQPPVSFLITARIGRTAWKYEDIAYRLIQNDLGGLYQTLYLTATALGMGPCAIGNVDASLFADVTGRDDRDEPWIGALTLYP